MVNSVQDYEVNYDPMQWIYGFGLSNDATTPNTIIDIAAGIAFDSNAVYELRSPAALKINSAINGVGGLDTGAIGASAFYAIYIIGDSRGYEPVAAIMSLASNAAPLMPFGYDSYRLIGYVATDGSKNFLLFYNNGNGNNRWFYYDTPIASPISAGTSSTYAPDDLSGLVPALAGIPVLIYYVFTPAAASNVFNMQPYGGTGDAVTVTGQVMSVPVTGTAIVLTGLNAGKPEINYKVSGGSVAIDVAGFGYFA